MGARWVAVVAAAALCAPALAADGALQIDQACATTSGCFAGDDPGFPVQIVAPGKYVLASNLTVPVVDEHGITIAADDVNLDLGGFLVAGPYTCGFLGCAPGSGRAGSGITRTGAGGDRSSVRDGGVQGFQYDGIVLGAHSRVEQTALVDVGGNAIRLDAYGMAFENTVNQIGGTGLVLGSGSLYRENTIAILGTSVEGGRASRANTCLDRSCGTRGKRLFYLTSAEKLASEALGECAAGFHMASLWEIFDLGEVEYDRSRGYVALDADGGPPTQSGWIRTGLLSSTTSGAPGLANCSLWTSTSSADVGSYATPSSDWLDTIASVDPQEIQPWRGFTDSCRDLVDRHRVWCVQD